MKTRGRAIGKAAAALVIIVVVASLAFGAYGLANPRTVETSYVSTTTYTTTVFKNVEMVGNCTAVSYLIPDTVVVTFTNVTVTSGGSTTYSEGTVTVSTAGETTLGTTTYATSTYANSTAAYSMTSTSVDTNEIPSNGWTVTVCAFAP